MKIIVEKYGGSSLSSVERICRIAQRVVATAESGAGVVVVVSAMGDTTDQLLSTVNLINESPRERELGLLLSTGEVVSSSLMAMALQKLGKNATALTGPQCGIRTNRDYDNARIEDIDTRRLKECLRMGEIVVVSGYQGSYEDDITVLGRGGSDATAVALAAVLGAEECRIYSDVPGVLTADPRIVRDASLLSVISYEEMIELAASGGQIMMGRAVEIARKYGMKIYVGSSFNGKTGTLITKESELENVVVTGISADLNVALVRIHGLPGQPLDTAGILQRIAEKEIKIIILSQQYSAAGSAVLSIIIKPEDVDAIYETLIDFLDKERIEAYELVRDVAQVAVVGSGIAEHRGVAAAMFTALSDKHIPVLMTSTSEIKITAIIRERDAEETVNTLHNTYNLSGLTRKLRSEHYAKN
ncbi:aspartate kinase [candidate division KSB1 bacterium]